MDLMNLSLLVSETALIWLIQSSLLILIGLLAARLLQKRGAAFQSAIYRTTLVAAFICPLATLCLSQTELPGWSLRFPDKWQTETLAQIPPQLAIASSPSHANHVIAQQEPSSFDKIALAESSTQVSSATRVKTTPAQSSPKLQADRSTPTSNQPKSRPVTQSTGSEAIAQAAIPISSPPQELSASDIARPCAAVVVCVSLAITLLLLGRLLSGYWSMFRIRNMAVAADEATLEVCSDLSSVLRVKVPRVLRSPYLSSPCLTGLIRPVVLLPEDHRKLSIREVLTHELAHLLRRDCHWNLLRQLATALFFFHPGLWYLSRKIETSAEEVCDDFVVHFGADRQHYARRLVAIAELSLAPTSPAGAGMVSFRSMLASRVERILDTSRSLSTRVGHLFKVLLFSGGMIGTAAAGFVGLSPIQDAVDSEKSNSRTQQASDSTPLPQSSLEDRGVSHLKSQLRYALDRVIFPPQGKGTSSDPGVLRGALSSIFGTNSRIMDQLESDPDVYRKVVQRIENWNPEYPADYDPGWKFTHRLDKAAIAKEVASAREKLLPALRRKAILLNDERFQDALTELQENKKRLDRYISMSDKEFSKDFDHLQYHEVQVRERAKLHEVEWELIPESRWHAKVGWRARAYFTDQDVIKLCQAIEVNDLQRMRELIEQGANVNAIGKGNMTPLLWSYPDLKFERFEMLLKAGADPNVMASGGVKTKRHRFQPPLTDFPIYEDFESGSSVNLLAYQIRDTRYWRAVLEHGGDANQATPKRGTALLHLVLSSEAWNYTEIMSVVKALVKKGVNLSSLDSHGRPPLTAVIKERQYEIATFLVESGADLNAKHRQHGRDQKTPTELVEAMKPFGHYVDRPEISDESNAYYRKLAAKTAVKQQALHDAMLQRGADFGAALVSLKQGPAFGLARARAFRVKELANHVNRKQKSLRTVYSSENIHDPARSREFEKYYRHTSPDFSRPTSGINFSIKRVTKNQLKNVKTSLPEFAAFGSKFHASILIGPSFSSHSDWLVANVGNLSCYLRHLAVKKCKLLDRVSADFPDLDTNTEDYYFLEVANNERHNELLIPVEYLHDEALRRESGLEAFVEIWKVLEEFKMRAFVESRGQTGFLLAETNKQLKAQFPDAKSRFYIEHLTSSDLDESGVIQCTFEFSETSKLESDFKYIASCKCNRWANDSAPRQRLAELKNESKALIGAHSRSRKVVSAADEARYRKWQEEIRALEKVVKADQLTIEVTRQ